MNACGQSTALGHTCEDDHVVFDVGARVVASQNKRTLAGMGSGPLQRPRHGVVEEVLRGDPIPRYRIRWDFGPQSVFAPTGDQGLLAEDDPAAG
jgi:hypothetical protein